jgi:hypothetical protein
MEAAETVLAHLGWAWAKFLAFRGPHEEWALDVLRPFVQPGDNAPACLAEPRRTATQ